jgi:hypothetical protein
MALLSGNLPRNQIFRERRVLLTLEGTSLTTPGGSATLTAFKPGNIITSPKVTLPGGAVIDPKFISLKRLRSSGKTLKGIPTAFKLELTEVKSVSMKSAGSTAIMPGVVVPVIQPWHFQPVVIEIQGESYMGAFDRESLNVTADNDVGNLWKMRDAINSLFANSSASIKNLRTRLAIGVQTSGNQSKDREFVGHINDISIDESDEKPYMWTYSIGFTGDFSFRFDLNRGAVAFRGDAGRAAATGTSGLRVGRPVGPVAVR